MGFKSDISDCYKVPIFWRELGLKTVTNSLSEKKHTNYSTNGYRTSGVVFNFGLSVRLVPLSFPARRRVLLYPPGKNRGYRSSEFYCYRGSQDVSTSVWRMMRNQYWTFLLKKMKKTVWNDLSLNISSSVPTWNITKFNYSFWYRFKRRNPCHLYPKFMIISYY